MSLDTLVCPDLAALVIIDMQNDYCHPNGAEALMGADVSPVTDMVPNLIALVEEAHCANIRTIYVRTLHSPWTNSGTWQRRGGGRHARSEVPLCLPGTWGARFYAGLEPRNSDDWDPARHDYVVTKHRYSAFIDTDLDLVLRSQRIQTLIVSGTSTNGCVESTAYHGFMRDYDIVCVADCTAASTPEQHARALRRVSRWATVSTAREVVAAWRG